MMIGNVIRKIKQLSIRDLTCYFFAIPKTIYFNFHYFPLKIAVKLPVIVSAKTKIVNMGGRVILNCDEIRLGMIRIGFGDIGIFDYKYSRSMWENRGCVVFSGGTSIGHGCKISCGETGVITF